ncbi:MAG: holin family protein [Roseicyclus sp.]
MGLIGRAIGSGVIASAGDAAEGLSEVFVANATRRQELDQEAFAMVQQAAMEEFRQSGEGLFDQMVNGLNRLPRPLMALGTIGLFVFAMTDPEGFTARMVGLDHVPEPLWWLLGAVVGFYFGARELHYLRHPRRALAGANRLGRLLPGRRRSARAAPGAENPALAEWLAEEEAAR